jgi:hypothetical protein
MPVRINNATRKNRDMSQYGGSSAGRSPFSNSAPNPYGPPAGGGAGPPAATAMPSGGQTTNVDSVRDDRGNPATKNLFVAGYGPGTTEPELRELVGQYANVTGVVLKGSFSFVNTCTLLLHIIICLCLPLSLPLSHIITCFCCNFYLFQRIGKRLCVHVRCLVALRSTVAS